jgi:hypothetical protein
VPEVSLLASIRPEAWHLPLFVHVLGAMILIGGVATALAAQGLGWRKRDPVDAHVFARLGFRALLYVAVPAWIVMRVAAEWIASEEGFTGDSVPAWIDVGYIAAEPGGLLLVASTILSGFGARRLRRRGEPSSGLVRASTVLISLALIAFLVAIWAMTAKPV